MKKYSHRIVLADDAALIAHFPAQNGKVTVLTLAEGKVTATAGQRGLRHLFEMRESAR